MIFTKIDTVIVRVADISSAQAWYEEKLDLVPNFWDDEQKIVVMETGGNAGLTLWQRDPDTGPPAPAKAGSYPIFFAEDLETSHRILKGRGVQVGDISWNAEGEGAWFGFTDPDGNWMEICTY